MIRRMSHRLGGAKGLAFLGMCIVLGLAGCGGEATEPDPADAPRFGGPFRVSQNDTVYLRLVRATTGDTLPLRTGSWTGQPDSIASVRPDGRLVAHRAGRLVVAVSLDSQVVRDTVLVEPATPAGIRGFNAYGVFWGAVLAGRPYAVDARGRTILDQAVSTTSRDSNAVRVRTLPDGVVRLEATGGGRTTFDLVAGSYRQEVVLIGVPESLDAWITTINGVPVPNGTVPLVIGVDTLHIKFLLRLHPDAGSIVYVNLAMSRLRGPLGNTVVLQPPDIQWGRITEHVFRVVGRIRDTTTLWLRPTDNGGVMVTGSQAVHLAGTEPFPDIEITSINGTPVAVGGPTPVADRFTVTMRVRMPAGAPPLRTLQLGGTIDADSALALPFNTTNILGAFAPAATVSLPGTHEVTWTAHQAPAGTYKVHAIGAVSDASVWMRPVDVTVTNADRTPPTVVVTPGHMAVVTVNDPEIAFDMSDAESGVHALVLGIPTLACGHAVARISNGHPEPIRAARLLFRPSNCFGRTLAVGANPFYVTVTDNAWLSRTDTITIVYDPTASAGVAAAPLPAGMIVLDQAWLRSGGRVLVETRDWRR